MFVSAGSARVPSSEMSPRSSTRSLVSMRRLNTIRESPAAARPRTPSSGVDVLDETGPGGSVLRGRRVPAPAQRRRSSNQVEDSDAAAAEGEEAAREHEAGDPLLRHSDGSEDRF